ncbi:sensor histidine kinase [Streptomyces anandii]|uniref:sensor histidine kinase n=1 Tax=Streptomyces anandii TaxID=285454 RepID=UPI00378B1592
MRIHPLAVDGLTALVPATVACLLGAEAATQGWPTLDASAWTLVALINLPLVVRGRAPVAVFLVIHLAWIVYVALGHWPVVNSPAALVAFYTVASTRSHRTTAVCAVVMGGVWVCAGLISGSDAMASVVGQAIGYPLILWRFGYHARRSAELTVQLRAEQAERARREVAEERVRIARELHDVVAHHMAVINVQAGLARFVFDDDAGTARVALGAIGDASAEALAELRRMLGLLRSDSTPETEPGAAEPAPGLDRLEEMVDRVRAGGVPVDLRVRGAPVPLSSGVQLCVYRVVQEALTNVLKHAPGARATVELGYAPGELTVSVVDDAKSDGKGVDSDKMREHVGHGLIGMHERAKLYGGTIVVGPRSEGGFGVRLTLPTSVHAARRGDTVRE